MPSTGDTMLSQTHMVLALCGLWSKILTNTYQIFIKPCCEGEILTSWSWGRTLDSEEFLRSDI